MMRCIDHPTMLKDGSGWGAEDPPADEALREKFRWLTRTTLSDDRARRLKEMIWQVADLPDIVALLNLLTSPPNLE